jgi:hypothetical protein
VQRLPGGEGNQRHAASVLDGQVGGNDGRPLLLDSDVLSVGSEVSRLGDVRRFEGKYFIADLKLRTSSMISIVGDT